MSNGRVEISKGKSGKLQKLKKNIHANNFACFVVVTDHSSLGWLMNVKGASGRLAR